MSDLIASNGLDPLVIDPTDPLLDFDLNFDAQLGRAAAAPPDDPASTAASFLIGLNDYNAFRPSLSDPTGAALVADVVAANLEAGAQAAAAGIGTLIYYTLPDPLFFPGTALLPPPLPEIGQGLIDGHNAALRDGLASLEATLAPQGTEIEIVDLGAFAAELQADPTA